MENDHTNQLHKSSAQDRMTSQPRMEITDDTFKCSRATQVCMEADRIPTIRAVSIPNPNGQRMNQQP